jgi:hypothetical protein
MKCIVCSLTACLLGVVLYSNAGAKTFDVTIEGQIDIGSVDEAVEVVEKSGLGDLIRIHIKSPGGRTYEMLKLREAIQESDAFISCYVKDYAASAAANLLMTCDEYHVSATALILFHMGSVQFPDNPDGTPGKMLKITLKNALNNPGLRWIVDFTVADYTDVGIKCILTDDEWDKMLSGKDIRLDGNEFNRRMANGCVSDS